MTRIFLIVLFFLSLSSCVKADSDPKAAYTLFKEGKATIIDVREADELNSGMIQGAHWIPLSKIQSEKNWKEELIKQVGGKRIFLYCRSGRRSGTVKDMLKENGVESENLGGFEHLKTLLPVKIPGP